MYDSDSTGQTISCVCVLCLFCFCCFQKLYYVETNVANGVHVGHSINVQHEK